MTSRTRTPARPPGRPPPPDIEARTFRLYATEPMTLAECGEQLGITKERVRQIETKALDKARAILAARGLGVEDLLGD